MMNEITTLPIFRIAGLQHTVPREHAQRTAQTLRTQWYQQAIDLPEFSQTLYLVYQYPDEHHTLITIGKLVSNDAVLPEQISEVWIPPQQYAVFSAQNADISDIWVQIHANNGELNRRFHTDFETYPIVGVPKIYIGLQAEAEISDVL